MNATAAIQADVLTRVFGDRVAVDAISFEVAPGEIFGFLGPNGAGKSTTARMLTGFIPPTSGRALVNGVDVAQRRGATLAWSRRKPTPTPTFRCGTTSC